MSAVESWLMCGIIGYRGSRDATAVVLEGLKKLEYRGYDSFGVASLAVNKLVVFKQVGAISDFGYADMPLTRTNLAVGHTRWATHGAVTTANAHPQLSNDGKIAVLHNGIIDNWEALRQLLVHEGFTFSSGTDTEVIPNLIQLYISKGYAFHDAMRTTLQHLHGSYAVIVLHEDFDEIAFAKVGSPLLVGRGDNEFFIASDLSAFAKYTTNVVVLPDFHYGFITSNVSLFSLDSESRVEIPYQTIAVDVDEEEDPAIQQYMLKEIMEQPRVLLRAIDQSKDRFELLAEIIRKSQKVFFTGCGTSFHAGLAASYFFASVAKINCTPFLSSETGKLVEFFDDKSVLIALSQSGETADVLDAVKLAKNRGAVVIALVNVQGTTLPLLADHTLYLRAGVERCVLSTKTFTAQLGLLYLLAHTVAGNFSLAHTILNQLAASIQEVLITQAAVIRQVAEKTYNNSDYFIIGRDFASACAVEGALKIKEVSYIHAEGFAGGELKHGTLALVRESIPTVVLVTPDTRTRILSNAMEVKSRKGCIIGVDSLPNSVFDYFIQIPHVSEGLSLLLCIPLQLLAYNLAILRGCDPDKPRNLAKSVTVQ
ncbi:MAG: glutamine--fructose-6-phosphate transaminase (isomerizing) [Candidatus Aenigmarchaeota archaeon]|nr:glutamine--fructose-6-phosphate transaminase (isomerizing) [Candidatus Aenigmarchaeota archaeon]